MTDVEMIIVNGVRYRREDAVKLGILGPAAVTPARYLHGEPDPEDPEVIVTDDTGDEGEDPVEKDEPAPEDPDEVEESEDGAESGVDTPAGKPGGSRRKAPRRVN